jgi:poly(3-hydroxybutyrate) depolymerase
MGCSKPATETPNQWVESMVMTSGANRPYSVRLPTGYDQTRAYPVVMLLHGCSSGTNNVPMEKVTGADAILVRGTGSAANTCWDTGATGPDVAFFDDMVKDVKARFCADEHRVFIVGYSSGSWLVNQLTCIRADVVRAGASVSGGESSNGKCGGPVARIFLHDTTDTDNVIAGSEKARDRQLTQNSCDKAAAPMPVDPSPCTQYQGCAAGYPVNWCVTTGKAHGRQDDFAPGAFWNFFKSL